MRAVVTGGAGFIGSHLARALRARGDEVVVVDSMRSGDWTRVPEGAERVDADLRDLQSEDWRQILAGADVLFHLAAEKYNSSRTTPERVLEVNVLGTDRLFRAAAEAGVGHVVFTSSLYAYGSTGPDPMRETDVPAPTTTYGASKLAGEHLLRTVGHETGMRWSIARLFFVYGPGQYADGGYKSVIVTGFERLRSGLPLLVKGSGTQSLDYVFVDDVVDALLRLAEARHSGLTVNIGTGHPTTINDLTVLLAETARVVPNVERVAADWTDGTNRYCDPNLAARTLGWSARTSLADGLNRTWQE